MFQYILKTDEQDQGELFELPGWFTNQNIEAGLNAMANQSYNYCSLLEDGVSIAHYKKENGVWVVHT